MTDIDQISMMSMVATPFKFRKPIRLIELFAGIGAQARAFERLAEKGVLKVPFEHYRICEFDKYAVASYNAVHGTNFGVSDITEIHADDLGICDRGKYDYVLTYSFPCTDLSMAGLRMGMDKGSGTRSGLLWEVERLLNELGKELPQVLLMENVTQVHRNKNEQNFNDWCAFLESKGYTNYWHDMNAKNYGIPQNRDRTFMVSLLGDDTYHFPQPIELTTCLRDFLDEEVDEKYYVTDEAAMQVIREYEERLKAEQSNDGQEED